MIHARLRAHPEQPVLFFMLSPLRTLCYRVHAISIAIMLAERLRAARYMQNHQRVLLISERAHKAI